MADLLPPNSRIAIVEDEAIVMLDLCKRLERMGLGIENTFARGEDALAWLAAGEALPDLFLMDIRLAGELSGIETADTIIHSYHIPVVILTAFTDAQTAAAALDVSPYGYIVKPFDERELRTGITIALLRHRVETGIAQGRALFAAAIEGLPDGILITNTDDRIVATNSLLRDMLGLTESDLCGLHSRELLERYCLLPDGTPRFLQAASPGWVEVTTAELTQDPYGRLVIFRDVTSRQEAEQQLAEAQRYLHHSAKMEALGRMSEGVAHDFNNMLAVMTGHMAVLQQHWQEQKDCGSESPKIDDSIAGVMAATRNSSELIRQLMAFSRSQQMHPRTFALDEVLRPTVDLLRSLLRQDIELVYTPTAVATRVYTDKTQLEQVIINLVLNAQDVTQAGGSIELKVCTLQLTEPYTTIVDTLLPGSYAVISVRDNGPGIPPELLEHIFEPFYSTKKGAHSYGLGLSIIFGIVQQSKGGIRIRDNSPAGTVVDVYLPLQDELESGGGNQV